MIAKLTLTIEQSLVNKAKQIAKSQGSSLSEMVANYFKLIGKEPGSRKGDSAPITRSLRGSFKAPGKLNYKKALSEQLSKKYL